MKKTLISWTNVTWNPTHGCHKVSEGCRNCYAEALSLRYGFTKKPWTAANKKENVILKPHKLKEPYGLKKPSRVFVNSMSDLFHEQIPDEYLKQVFDVMNDLPQHTFQILTKRPERAAQWKTGWTENILMGTSIEDSRVLHRLDELKRCPAKKRFISFEPLIGDVGELDLTGIHWVIVGGESGKNRRELNQQWAINIKNQCVEQGVPFFFKQDSAPLTETRCWLVEPDGTRWIWHQFPGEFTPPVRVPDDWTKDREMPPNAPKSAPVLGKQMEQLSLLE